MRRYSLLYFLGQSIKGLWRNGVMSTASIMVLMSCLTVLGSFTLLVYNINYNLRDIGIFNDIVVYVDKDKNYAEVQQIFAQVQSLDNVQNAVLTTKDQVLAEEREKYSEYSSLFSSINEQNNPYPDTITVTYQDTNGVSTLEYQLQHIDGVSKIKSRWELAEKIENLKNGVILIFIWFLLVLFVVSVFVIINTIKLAVFSRRQEISIMRYVGATNWFITLPFVFEGVLIGLLSSGIAYLLEWYAYGYISKMVIIDYSMISVVAFDEVRLYILFGFIGIGIVTGIIGSVISLSKYLKV